MRRRTMEDARKERDGHDEDADEDVGDGQVGDEVVRHRPHLRVAVDDGDDEAIVDDADREDDDVGEGEEDDHRRRLTKQRPRLRRVV